VTPADLIVDAQLGEIKRLRRRLRDVERRNADLRRLAKLVPGLRRRLQREQTSRRNQHERAELWKHRALRR